MAHRKTSKLPGGALAKPAGKTPAKARRGAAASRPDVLSDGPSGEALAWLRRGLNQPGGKLPLFDRDGQRVNEDMVRDCLARGWAEPWFANPLKPDWLVCKLTAAGRRLATPDSAADLPDGAA